MTAAVTVSRKCYVVPCVVCRLLYPAHRTNSRTCSGACRVRLHRGFVDTFEQAAAHTARLYGWKVAPFDIRRTHAALELCPDRDADVAAGRVELDDIDADVVAAFWRLVHNEADEL